MDVTQLTNESLIDTLRAYPDHHPDRGPVIMEMRKRGMLGIDAQLYALHKASEGGNVNALRDFYNSGAGGKIDWGKKGDFASCVGIAGKFVTSEQAKGFCAQRHQDAVGGPPGSEDTKPPTKVTSQPVKKDNPEHVASGPEGGQFTFQGAGGGGGAGSASITSSAVVPPPNAFSPTSPIVNYTIVGGKGSGKRISVGPRSQIPPTPKITGLAPVHVKGSAPHIAKPKGVGTIKPKNVKGPKAPSAPKGHFGSGGKIKIKSPYKPA